MKTHTHRESAKPTIPRLDDLVGPENGLFVVPATIDPEVGEEVVLFLRDTAPNIETLCQIESLQLNVRAGVQSTLCGPVGWILFWVSPPNDPDTAAVSFVKCFNPHSKKDLAFWRRLADQGHWHMFLMVGNDMRDYFWYGDLELNEKLDEIIENRSPASSCDFAKAEEIFRQEVTAEDLRNLPDGRYSSWLVLGKS